MNTQDLTLFGFRELSMTRDLLEAFKGNNDKTEYLGNGVAVEFNPNSANVFLIDKDSNVAMMNGANLEDWFNCPHCGHEGFKEDMEHDIENIECKEYLASINDIDIEDYENYLKNKSN